LNIGLFLWIRIYRDRPAPNERRLSILQPRVLRGSLHFPRPPFTGRSFLFE
jgi:hypothetical protein